MTKKKLIMFLLLGPFLPRPAAAYTTVTTANAYMVENTSGTSPSGAVCYDFQTNPSCSASITGLSTGTFSSLLSSSNTWTGTNTFQSTTTFSGPINAGGFGTVGQFLTTNVGSAPSWTSGVATTSTNTWTAQQTFSSATVTQLNFSTMTKNGVTAYVLLYSSTICQSGQTQTTSSTFTQGAPVITITPHSLTSRVEVNINGDLQNTLNTDIAVATIMRGTAVNLATLLGGNSNGTPRFCASEPNVTANSYSTCAADVIDTPLTVSATTYAPYFASTNNTNTVGWGVQTNPCITVKEWGY